MALDLVVVYIPTWENLEYDLEVALLIGQHPRFKSYTVFTVNKPPAPPIDYEYLDEIGFMFQVGLSAIVVPADFDHGQLLPYLRPHQRIDVLVPRDREFDFEPLNLERHDLCGLPRRELIALGGVR